MRKGIKGLILVLLLVAVPLLGIAQDDEEPVRKKKRSNVSYFSKGTVFVYALGTTNSMKAPVDMYYELGPGSANGLAPMVGAGFRLISFGKIMFLNLTVDGSTGTFDFIDSPEQKVNSFTVMLDLEGFLFRPTPLSLHFGVGVSFVRFEDLGYWDDWEETWVSYGDETVTAMAIDLGMKLAVSKHLFLRTLLRFTGELLPSYDYDYWDDESDFVRFNTTFGFGVEYHF